MLFCISVAGCGIGSAGDESTASGGANSGSSVGGNDAGGAQNNAPTADAGVDQTVDVGAAVSLDGSGSSDDDGDTLSYSWSFQTRPAGSSAPLADDSAVTTSFTADIAGDYVIQLEVSDGAETSSPDSVTVTAVTLNSAPTANAGEDQNVVTGDEVQLDGSSSADPDGDLVTYSWTLLSSPSGSVASLSDQSVVDPTFVADFDGQYTLELVVSDSELQSSPDTVTITSETANSAPVANAGADQNVATNSIVLLDGSSSSDADGDGLSYQWEVQSSPSGSGAQLDDDTSVTPSFTADLDGTYTVSLTVNDAIIDSTPDTVSIVATTANSAPVADAGVDQEVTVGDQVALDAAASSDADGDPLTYSWQFSSLPEGSSTQLVNADQQIATFTPDSAGTYVVRLSVNDGQVDSDPDTVSVTAAAPPPSLRLFNFDPLFGNSERSWPYASNIVTAISTTANKCTVQSFRLDASGRDFTIVNLAATSSSPTANVSFSGLADSQVISDGSSVPFSLLSSDTNGSVTISYSFEVAETGDTFDVAGQLNCATP